MKKVIAVVVTFKRKSLLEDVIKGLAEQSYPLSEIIIIDNHSCDGTDILVDNLRKVYATSKISYHTAHIISAQDFMAININGIPTWSSQIGVLGYFYFYQVYAVLIIMFMFFILFISITLSKYLSRNKEIINLTWFLSLMLLCHGWFIPFINYVQCLAVFVALISILKTRTQKFVRN